MPYELGKARAIKVQGLTFLVKSTWGGIKKLQNEMKTLEGSGVDINDGSDPKMVEFTEDWLGRLIMGWENVEKDGEPVAWDISLLDELDPTIISELLEKAVGGPSPLADVTPTKQDND